MDYTRRDFGKLVIAGVPTVGLLTSEFALANVLQAKPNSKWAGVQVGMNVPYNFGTGNYTTGDEILAKCVQLGVQWGGTARAAGRALPRVARRRGRRCCRGGTRSRRRAGRRPRWRPTHDRS